MEDTEKQKAENLMDLLIAEYREGNVAVLGIEGLMRMPLADFIQQPADGMLYDLNRLEEVVLTSISDRKWVNDFAVAKTIRALKARIDELESASPSTPEVLDK